MNSLFTGELKTGNLIAVVSRKGQLTLAFYIGNESSNVIPYYTMEHLEEWKKLVPNTKGPWISYTGELKGIIKIDPEDLTDNYKKRFDNCINILKQLKVLL